MVVESSNDDDESSSSTKTNKRNPKIQGSSSSERARSARPPSSASAMARRTISALAAAAEGPASLITRSNSHLHGLLIVPRSANNCYSSWAHPQLEPDSTTISKPEKKLADRLSAVIDATNDRKLPPELRGQRNAVRSETDIINVVEQRIWQSMEEGQFENLPGKGKPLNLATNPHADPAEDTLYRILSQNGCAPEWVELNKEIRSQMAEWRSVLRKAHTNRSNGNDSKWIEVSEALKDRMCVINDKVFRYNLIVPFGRQMHGMKWEKELDRLVD